ncbi:MAG: hypothetical protein ACT4PM_00805 [Gemmatimonadales bacterium]
MNRMPRTAAGARASSGLAALLLLVNACGTSTPSQELLVTGQDYAFQLPDSMPPGLVAFRFYNSGKVPHEMGVSPRKPGVTLAQVLELDRRGGNVDSLFEGIVGILIVNPGDTAVGRLLVDLEPGRTYVFWCNFQDAPDQPRHINLGMIRSLDFGLTR